MSTQAKPLESLPEFLARSVLQHRLLLIVFFTTAVIGAWEYFHRGTPVNLHLDESKNFTNVMAELYPDDAGVQHMRAQQLTLCMQAMREGRILPSPCAQYTDLDPQATMMRFYEHGIAASKHIEDLYYDYALFLRFTGADSEAIDAAADNWRANFPLSDRPDPRTARQVAQGTDPARSDY